MTIPQEKLEVESLKAMHDLGGNPHPPDKLPTSSMLYSISIIQRLWVSAFEAGYRQRDGESQIESITRNEKQ